MAKKVPLYELNLVGRPVFRMMLLLLFIMLSSFRPSRSMIMFGDGICLIVFS